MARLFVTPQEGYSPILRGEEGCHSELVAGPRKNSLQYLCIEDRLRGDRKNA